jgi:ankyrin repeat protein
VEFLLAHGADVNAKNYKGQTPLFNARSLDIAELLLVHGADVNSTNNDGETPLQAALDQGGKGQKDVEELLRQHGGHE